MLKHLHVMAVEHRQAVSKTTGRPYELLAIQGAMHFQDGRVEVFVYDWFKRGDEPLPKIEANKLYLPVLEPVPNNQSRKLEARIASMRSVDVKAA